MWRFRHYAIVARALGEDTIGTQGTPVQVLGKLIAQRQLPKLWETRSRLVELFDAERAAECSAGAPERATTARISAPTCATASSPRSIMFTSEKNAWIMSS